MVWKWYTNAFIRYIDVFYVASMCIDEIASYESMDTHSKSMKTNTNNFQRPSPSNQWKPIQIHQARWICFSACCRIDVLVMFYSISTSSFIHGGIQLLIHEYISRKPVSSFGTQ